MPNKPEKSPVGLSMSERARRRLERRVRLAYQKERAARASGRSKMAARYHQQAKDWNRVLEAYRARASIEQAERLVRIAERSAAHSREVAAHRAAMAEAARKRGVP